MTAPGLKRVQARSHAADAFYSSTRSPGTEFAEALVEKYRKIPKPPPLRRPKSLPPPAAERGSR